MRLEDRARAAIVSDAAEAIADRGPVPMTRGVALYCRGLRDDDVDALAGSIEAFRRSGRALEPALASEATALALSRGDRLSEAKPLFRDAVEIYEGLGARRDAARVSASMRSFGIRRGSRAPRKRPSAGWGSLTPTEVEVVRLATRGLTNPQIAARLFVSRATVRTHLSHVFGKLGLESRVELAAEAAGHADLHHRAVHAALAIRRVFDRHQHGSAPFTAEGEALRDAQEQQDERRGDADGRV
jgi:DNA-binding CsgD family transcriptional regulator